MNDLLALYRDGFPEDGDAYSAWFTETYAAYAHVLVRDGRPVAAGYLVPRRLTIGGAEQPAYYLDAFSVLTPYRGTGVAAELMARMVAAARRSVRYVFLSPFNGTYYHRYGFTDLVCASYETIRGGTRLGVRPARPADVKRVYEDMTKGADTYFRRDDAFYEQCAADHVIAGDIAAGDVWQGEFEVTACTDYAALLACEELKGLRVAVPGTGQAFVQVVDLQAPGMCPTFGRTVILDKV